MFHDVQRLRKQSLSQRKTSEALNVNRRTVKRYESMTAEAFEAFIQAGASKPKLLDPYQEFIITRLQDAPAASAAQVHDWLKECHPGFPEVSPKTVYNYVMDIRQKYCISMDTVSRGMLMQAELPYGKQAQIDFGVYNMTTNDSGRKKVHFFTMVLSSSRMKFVLFSLKPFTTKTTIEAHERSFAFFGGIPEELVYDQDRVMMVSENLGELLLTREFRAYVDSLKAGLYYCRKSDPASKGKIENVVKFVKQNFLYGRKFYTLEILQQEAVLWLDRTANGNRHSITGLIPKEVWAKEVDHLRPYIAARITPAFKEHAVRKDSMISYKGNFYSVPVGMYKKGLKVFVGEQDQTLTVQNLEGKIICKHTIPEGKNHKVINNNHKRDTTLRIRDLKQKASLLFPNSLKGLIYLNAIHEKYPRYIRDQITGVSKLVANYPSDIVRQALDKCLEEKLYGCVPLGDALKEAAASHYEAPKNQIKDIPIMRDGVAHMATIRPNKRSLDAYDSMLESSQSILPKKK